MNPRNGLYGALLIGPKGAKYRDPKTGADISMKNSWVADVIVDRTIQGTSIELTTVTSLCSSRTRTTSLGRSFMPYVQNTAGLTAVNYRAEPYKFREEKGCTLGKVFQPCVVDKPGDPATPIIEAHAGDPVRIHVFGASKEQNGMFSVERHGWPIEPFMRGADMISVVEFSGSETLDAFIPTAGGPFRMPGDYVWSNQRLPYAQSGQWGYLRVLPPGDNRIRGLTDARSGSQRAGVQEEGLGGVLPVSVK